MNYLVELYDGKGAKVYNFRQTSANAAFLNLAELVNIEGKIYPFVTVTCYLNNKVVWEVEMKQELV